MYVGFREKPKNCGLLAATQGIFGMSAGEKDTDRVVFGATAAKFIVSMSALV